MITGIVVRESSSQDRVFLIASNSGEMYKHLQAHCSSPSTHTYYFHLKGFHCSTCPGAVDHLLANGPDSSGCAC